MDHYVEVTKTVKDFQIDLLINVDGKGYRFNMCGGTVGLLDFSGDGGSGMYYLTYEKLIELMKEHGRQSNYV